MPIHLKNYILCSADLYMKRPHKMVSDHPLYNIAKTAQCQASSQSAEHECIWLTDGSNSTSWIPQTAAQGEWLTLSFYQVSYICLWQVKMKITCAWSTPCTTNKNYLMHSFSCMKCLPLAGKNHSTNKN